MMQRRSALSVLGVSAMAPWVASWAGVLTPATQARTVPASAPPLWVWDPRCADRVAHALPRGVLPALRCDVAGDVSQAWFSVLLPHLQAHRSGLIGITQGDALFCLQRLAADKGWVVQLHGVQYAHVSPASLAADAQVYAWTLAMSSRA